MVIFDSEIVSEICPKEQSISKTCFYISKYRVGCYYQCSFTDCMIKQDPVAQEALNEGMRLLNGGKKTEASSFFDQVEVINSHIASSLP